MVVITGRFDLVRAHETDHREQAGVRALFEGSKPVSEHALGKWHDHFADDSKCLPEGPTRAPNSHSRARHDAREAPKTAENTIRRTKTAQQAHISRRAPRPQAHAIQNSR